MIAAENDLPRKQVRPALEAQSLVAAGIDLGVGLDLRIVIRKNRRGMSRVFQGLVSRYWLRLTVIELPLRINVKPAPSFVVLVALDVSGFAFPIISSTLMRQCNVEWGVMPLIGFRNRLQCHCRWCEFVLDLASLLFERLFIVVRHGRLLGLGLLVLNLAVGP